MQLRCSQDAPSPSAAQHGASCAHFPPTRRAVRSPLPTRPHDPSVAIVRSWGRCGLPGSRAGCAMDEPSPVLPIFHYRYRVDMRLPSPNPAGPYCPQAPVPPDRVVSPPVAAAVACAALAQTASVLSPSAFALSLRAFRGVRYAPFPFRTRLPLWARSPVQARRPTLLSQTLRRLRLRRRLAGTDVIRSCHLRLSLRSAGCRTHALALIPSILWHSGSGHSHCYITPPPVSLM